MFDENPDNYGPEKPTWKDIEEEINIYIAHYCSGCNNAVIHYTCYVSTQFDIHGMFARVGNEIIRDLITSIILELTTLDPSDICFQQFIKRLELRRKNYE